MLKQRSFMRVLVGALATLAAIGLAACSDDDPDPASTDDVTTTAAADTGGTGSSPDTDPASVTSVAEELPPPDEATFTGQARVLNLYVDDAGEQQEIDVWAQRTFTNGPVLLAESIGFAEASEYFATPSGHSIIFTPAGSGPDGEELGSMFAAQEGEQVTAVYEWDVDGPFIPNDYEKDESGNQPVEEPPSTGQGLVILRATQLIPYEESLIEAGLDRSYKVGDGSDVCPTQRVEADGFSPSVLGGTQPVFVDLPSGPATITLHQWTSPDNCASDPLVEFDVDVPDGQAVLVHLYTRDGETLETLTLPVG